ncbi:MAG: hypothetical protein LBK13_12355 [Spirochaetales bacterium]|jgi:hypothetical protein|nr:hypothetical protein [Spirochaetales bacterium]
MRTKRYFFGLPVVLLAMSASLTLGLVLTGCVGDGDGGGPIKASTAEQYSIRRM